MFGYYVRETNCDGDLKRQMQNYYANANMLLRKKFLSILFWFYSNKHYFQITFLHSKKILGRLACICF